MAKHTSIKITLKENGLHSLWKGIESYWAYERTKNKWLLKEAILFVHHGIELLMKEILVRHSEYLIFADIGASTVRKQKQANSQGIGVFYLPKPPKTVTYLDAIDRVEAFIHPDNLDSLLLSRLYDLNRLRNQLEHYEIDVDAEQVEELFGDLREPLLDLFESQLGGVKQGEPRRVQQAWTRIEDIARQGYLYEQEVIDLIQCFNGQRVPGTIFNVEGELTLPYFTKITRELFRRFDILAESDDSTWVVEVKSRRYLPLQSIDSFFSAGSMLNNPTLWLVFFGDLTSGPRKRARDLGILLTGKQEWDELKRLLQA